MSVRRDMGVGWGGFPHVVKALPPHLEKGGLGMCVGGAGEAVVNVFCARCSEIVQLY